MSNASAWALSAAPEAIITAASTSSGCAVIHSITWMPPKLPPTSPARWVMPSSRRSARYTSTVSPIEKRGNAPPHGFPVAGFTLDGPVVPLQPPSTFAHTTRKRFVSMALPGPTMPSHQPVGASSPGCLPATCASPVRAWQMNTTLSFSGFSSPQLSHATSTRGRTPPSSRRNPPSGSFNVVTCVSTTPTQFFSFSLTAGDIISYSTARHKRKTEHRRCE